MKAFLLAVALAAIPGAALAADEPIQYADLAKSGFQKIEWKDLTPPEIESFYKAYPADREMLDRVRLGDDATDTLRECIAGEAPPVIEAQKAFPLHYPLLGRMKNVAGTFEWRGKKLFFRTARQLYPTDEGNILNRLKQLGVTDKSGPRQATIEAVWFVNRPDGLRLLYLQKIDLH